MNILILNWRDPKNPMAGGAETVTLEHAKGWIDKGHAVTWFTSAFPGCLRQEILDEVKILRRGSALGVYALAPFYVKLNEKRFDIIVDQVHGIPFFTPLYTRIPHVVLIHEIAGSIWDAMYRFPLNFIGKTLEQWYLYIYRRSYFWTIAPSTVKELISRGIPANRCVPIPAPITASELRRNMLILEKAKKPTYIFVSRVVRMKGIEEVIKAFSFINRVDPVSQLWIIGGGDPGYITELRKMIHEYDVDKNVTFYGSVSEQKKFQLMARAHILLHASVKEGWGLVVLEAASVGTPAVVYNVPGLKDIVKHRQTGIVIQSNSPKDMASEALHLLHDSATYNMYSKNGIRWEKSITWGRVVKESENLLLKVAGKNQP